MKELKRSFSARLREEQGSVLIMTTLAIVVVMGIVGLAMDGGAMYVARENAQAAADAAAQAGVMDMYRGLSPSGGTYGSAHTCTTTDNWPPCRYARSNGFLNGTFSDQVTVDFAGPGVGGGATSGWCSVPTNADGTSQVNLSGSDQVQLICVKAQRTVNTMLMRVFGHNRSTVAATAVAAISLTPSLLPIAVLHPTLSGSFSKNGSNTITICGGPARSIQVNSTSTSSISIAGNSGTIDLSHAGPLDSGACDTGTGADFANAGAEALPGGANVLWGTKPGVYVDPASPVEDPLLLVPAPTRPALASAPINANTAALEAAHNCPTACTVYSPGLYDGTTGHDLSKVSGFSVFRPGIYWISSGGFQLTSNTIVRMATAAADETDPTGVTNWTQNVMFYNSASTSKDIFSFPANAGQLPGGNTYPTTDCPNGGNCLVGSPMNGTYKGILFFQNRANAISLAHSFSGGGGLSLQGTIYLTHTVANIRSDGKYQSLTLQGNSGGTTKVRGEIIVDALSLGGNSGVTMNLSGAPIFSVRQVALIQ
jgi:hypothetical protein